MRDTDGFRGGIYVLLISVALCAGLISIILEDRFDDARQAAELTGEAAPVE